MLQLENLDAHASIARLLFASQNHDPTIVSILVQLLKNNTLDWKTVEKFTGSDAWTTESARKQTAAIENLESRIKAAKSAMSKEPMREAHMSAGDILFSMRDYAVCPLINL